MYDYIKTLLLLLACLLVFVIFVYLCEGFWGPFFVCIGILIIVICLFKYIIGLEKRMQKCPHGVKGGLTQNKCELCRIEQVKRERRIEQELKERRRLEDIRARAKSLQEEQERALVQSKLTTIDNLISLSPKAFEDAVAVMYERLGYKVKQTPYSNDKGKDAILKKNGVKYLVECKRYAPNRRIGRPSLQKFYAAIVEEGASMGFFVTTSEFAKTAYEYGPKFKIELINGPRLVSLMNEAFPDQIPIDKIKVMCLQCGDIVNFPVSSNNETRTCRNGHSVSCNIDIDNLSRRAFRNYLATIPNANN